MTLLMTVLWVAATQFIKSTYTGLLSPPVSRLASELATNRKWSDLKIAGRRLLVQVADVAAVQRDRGHLEAVGRQRRRDDAGRERNVGCDARGNWFYHWTPLRALLCFGDATFEGNVQLQRKTDGRTRAVFSLHNPHLVRECNAAAQQPRVARHI